MSRGSAKEISNSAKRRYRTLKETTRSDNVSVDEDDENAINNDFTTGFDRNRERIQLLALTKRRSMVAEDQNEANAANRIAFEPLVKERTHKAR